MPDEDRTLAALAYGVGALLPVLGPGVLWLASRSRRPFVALHARKATIDSAWIHAVGAVLLAASVAVELSLLYREASQGAEVDSVGIVRTAGLSPWTLGVLAAAAVFYWVKLVQGGLRAMRGEWPA